MSPQDAVNNTSRPMRLGDLVMAINNATTTQVFTSRRAAFDGNARRASLWPEASRKRNHMQSTLLHFHLLLYRSNHTAHEDPFNTCGS